MSVGAIRGFGRDNQAFTVFWRYRTATKTFRLHPKAWRSLLLFRPMPGRCSSGNWGFGGDRTHRAGADALRRGWIGVTMKPLIGYGSDVSAPSSA